MKTFTINKQFDSDGLGKEMLAAGVNVVTFRGFGHVGGSLPLTGEVVTNDAAVDATVNAVITAHNPVVSLAASVAAGRVVEIAQQQWHDVRCYVPADITTTLATFVDVTGMSFPIGPNEIWNAELKCFCQGNTAGIKLQVIGPASPVRAVVGFDGHSTTVSLKTFNPKASPAYGVPSIAYCVNATPFLGLVEVYLQIANGPTAGVVKLQVASTTAGQSTKVSAGSFGLARRAA